MRFARANTGGLRVATGATSRARNTILLPNSTVRHALVPYPTKQSVVANLVATVSMGEGWGADFVRAAYRRWFQRGEETGSEPNLSESLHDIGQEPKRALALANSENTKATLVAETDAARELGIFGSPTFTVGRELFGATTGSLMPSAGAVLAASNMTRSSYWRCFHLSQVEY